MEASLPGSIDPVRSKSVVSVGSMRNTGLDVGERRPRMRCDGRDASRTGGLREAMEGDDWPSDCIVFVLYPKEDEDDTS